MEDWLRHVEVKVTALEVIQNVTDTLLLRSDYELLAEPETLSLGLLQFNIYLSSQH
jgi:hypothetical protein